MTAAANVERLELVRAALSGLGDGNPVALAAARSLLEARDLPLEDARVQLRAEALRLDEAIAKGRGGKAMGAPAAAAPAAPVEPVSPVPDGNYEALHPRGTGGMFIRKGDSGSHVSAMQTRLGELGHHQGQVDGNFGRQTLASVKSLQKAHGLPQTGVVDQRTLELMRMPPTTTKSQSSAQLRAALLAAGKTAKPGDVGENVSTVQGALGALGFQVNDPQGTYGPGTEAAVRQLQQRSGLAPTGRLDEQTAALIATATPGQENHAAGGLEGSDPSGWGLKPQGKRSPGRMTDKPSAGGANPRSKSSPRPRQGAKGGKAVKEATYSGTAAVAATAVTRTARILGITQPPNLREAPAASFDACASCVFFSGQSCLKYDGYPVDRDDLCDDWLTLTPAKDRPGKVEDNQVGEVDEADVEAARAEREALIVEATSDPELEEMWSEASRAAALVARRAHMGGRSKERPLHPEKHGFATAWQGNGAPKTHEAYVKRAIGRPGGDTSLFKQEHHAVVKSLRALGHHDLADALHREHGVAESKGAGHYHISPALHAKIHARLAKPKVRESLEVEEVKSSAYPSLDRSPKKNWVDKAGGLPSYIERIAKHLHYEQGKDVSQAIQIAIGVVKRWCAGGGAGAHGAGPSHVTAKTKAQACAAVAQWEKMKASTHVKEAAPASLEEALSTEGAWWLEENGEMADPSLRYCERLLGRIQEAHDDWDDLPPPTFADVVWAEEAAWQLAPAAFDAEVEPFMRVVGETPVLFVAGCPIRTFDSIQEAAGMAAAARTYSVGVRKKNDKRTKFRASERLAKNFDPVETSHNEADVAVHAVVSKRFAGAGARPRTLAQDNGSGSMQEADDPELKAGSGKGALAGGAAGRSVLELAESLLKFDPIKHPRTRGGEFRETFGHDVAHMADRILGHHHEGVASPAQDSGKGGALDVDQAIGGVLQSFPGLIDWHVKKADDGEWHVHVKMPGEQHVIHVTDAGDVHLEADHGKTAAQHVPPSAEALKAGEYELSGDTEQPYHMVDGQVFQGKKGGWFTKVEHGKMTTAKGWTGAGVHIHDHQTGAKKWVPSFVMKEHLPLAYAHGEAPEKPVPASKGDLFGDLMSSVGGNATGAGEVSFSGKNVVVTGKIPGFTRPEVHAMLKAKGATPQSSVTGDTHYLITGDAVGATKTNAAAKKGVQVVQWNDVHHLVESALTPRVTRMLGYRAQLEEADALERRVLMARLDVLEARLDDDDRAALAIVSPGPLARFGVHSVREPRRR